MPTALRIGALRVVVYPNDQRPPHVHVIGDGHEAVFNLDRLTGSVLLRENYGFSARNLSRIQSELIENLAILLRAWEGIHGR
jgi:hypothetical protein